MQTTSSKAKGSAPESSARGLLSLCMIVKNEERVLADCLASVRGVVDEIIIVDTGSTDSTIKTAESHGAKIFHFPWNGSFSDARNEALSHCTCRYILHLDADERLESRGREQLRALAHGGAFDACMLQIVSRMSEGDRVTETVSDQPRLFRRDERFRFRYRIHESILPSIREAKGVIIKKTIAVRHVGYDISAEQLQMKNLRNYEQLVIGVLEHPNDLFMLKKYAQTLLSLGRYEEAVREIRRMLEKIAGGECGTVTNAASAAFHNLYADALIKTGAHAEAAQWAEESLRLLGNQNMAHYYLMKINDHLGKYEKALAHLDAIATGVRAASDDDSAMPEDDITPAPQDVCYKRAALYRAMKKPKEERRELEAAIRIAPRLTPALYRLAAWHEQDGDFPRALDFITRARETNPSDGAIHYVRARILLLMKKSSEALEDAARAFACGEQGDALLRLWITAARESGRDAEALPAYALVMERRPEDLETLMSYIQLLVQVMDISTALRVIDRSLPCVKDEAMRQTLTAIHGKLAFAAQTL